MSTAVQVGKETTHGTVAAAFTTVPCAFNANNRQANKVLDEDRNGQDSHFAMVVGQKYEEFSVGDSAIYHDTIGLWLASAIGPAVSTAHAGETTVFDNVFKFDDDPDTLSLKWQQPRRYTQAYQSLYGAVDKMDFKFAADGDLTYSLSGVAMAESEVAQLTPTFSAVVPLSAWAGSVDIGGGANADLVSGSVSISRSRKPFYTIANTQDPSKISIGRRMVEFELVLDFVTKAEYDFFKAGTTRDLEIVWTDATSDLGVVPTNPSFTIRLGNTGYEESEIDTDPDLPLVKIKGKAMYDSSDASTIVVTVVSTTDYEA